MFGVAHKHRYFRIQVIVSVGVSMLAFFADRAGLLEATSSTSSAQSIGVPLFTIGPVLAACVIVYFQHGTLQLKSVMLAALFLYAVVLVWPIVIASNEGADSFHAQETSYFIVLNFVGFLIFGGCTALLGKLLGIITLAIFVLSASSGTSELLLLTPALAALNITNAYAQWAVAIVITASSLMADR